MLYTIKMHGWGGDYRQDGWVFYTIKLDGWAQDCRKDARVLLYAIKEGRMAGFYTLSSWTAGPKTM